MQTDVLPPCPEPVRTWILAARTPTLPAAIMPVLVGALVTAILVVNNLRDVDTDDAAGKRTLAVRLGRSGMCLEYVLLLLIAYLAPLASWLVVGSPTVFWLPWLTLPLAVGLVRLVLTEEGRPLNAALAGTGRLHRLFGILFSASIAL